MPTMYEVMLSQLQERLQYNMEQIEEQQQIENDYHIGEYHFSDDLAYGFESIDLYR